MFKGQGWQGRRKWVAVALAVLACASSALAAGNTVTVRVGNAWIRWLPSSLPAAGYVTLSNPGEATIVLIGAESPDYGSAMLHESRIREGVSEMVPTEKIAIPPHGAISLKPGGSHIMLMQAKVHLVPGDAVPIKLHFEGGESLTVSFEVRKADGSRVDSPN